MGAARSQFASGSVQSLQANRKDTIHRLKDLLGSLGVQV